MGPIFRHRGVSITEPPRPQTKPEVVTVAQTLLWVLFANGFAVTAYEFIRTQFYLNGARDYFSIALIAAVTAAFGVLSALLSRRGLLTWCSAMLLCVSVAVLIAALLLPEMSEPEGYERKSRPELMLWVLTYVAMPLAAVACLATRGARKWCFNRGEATTND
ncbi:hypothetical protein O1R50_19265 [Glycomyces luteolus]|uniref:Uncharacterized protein n=1 Tax=Glycomyces luteolus TaxID=2670330 RepID=A0A9X3PB29_9ACTN|nr:hypothetical protein [Glycomyces luteolus]MDA1361777.1 hypothetical protein [Glycomyces luteolus]